MTDPIPRTRYRQATKHLPRTEVDRLLRCRRDLAFYAENQLVIADKQGIERKFVFNRAQQIVHAKLSSQWREKGFIKAICLKARQEGISTLVAGRFFRRVHLNQNQKVAIVADQKDKAKGLFEMYQRFYENVPEKPETETTQKREILKLVNGSQLVVETAGDETSGRSQTIQALHLSEAAFYPNAATVFLALTEAMPDKGSEIIIESTANGVGNWFHQKYEQAKAGQSDYIAIFLPWWIHEEYETKITAEEEQEILSSDDEFERRAQDLGIEYEGEYHRLTPQQLAWRRRRIANNCDGDVRRFQQENPSDDQEAFLVSGNPFFDEDALKKYQYTTTYERPVKIRGDIAYEDGNLFVKPSPRGSLKVWEAPTDNAIYVIAADTAKGKRVGPISERRTIDEFDAERGGSDYSCADVLKVERDEHGRYYKQVAQFHARIKPDLFAYELVKLGYWYGSKGPDGMRFPATLAPEKNHSSAETIIRILLDECPAPCPGSRYPALYFSRSMNKRNNRITPIAGWNTSMVTRHPMLDELESLIRHERIDIGCLETIRECYSFIVDEDGEPRAQEGAHDDRVLTLAIAVQVARSLSHEPPKGELPKIETYNSPTGAFDYGYDIP